MLDAFIIDRIRREQEQRDRHRDGRTPLYIEEGPQSERRAPRREEKDTPNGDRGSVIIDYTA